MIEITANLTEELASFLESPTLLEKNVGKTCWLAVSKENNEKINGAIDFGSKTSFFYKKKSYIFDSKISFFVYVFNLDALQRFYRTCERKIASFENNSAIYVKRASKETSFSVKFEF